MTQKKQDRTTRKVPSGHEKFAFVKGYGLLAVKDAKKVRTEIMTALDLKSRMAWYNRLYGVVEPKISEHDAIEKVFARYGIDNCWGA